VAVCEQAGLRVADVPDGLDTHVSRRAGLSAGQRRRAALARVLLDPGRIVLLDEPTASVDAESEAAIVGAVRELAAQGRVVVLVSHREATLAAADRVVSMTPALAGGL
jgi:ABC-type multidrug transport system fused ATPase/permease subunit